VIISQTWFKLLLSNGMKTTKVSFMQFEYNTTLLNTNSPYWKRLPVEVEDWDWWIKHSTAMPGYLWGWYYHLSCTAISNSCRRWRIWIGLRIRL
jgi:hypothetical protein